MCISSIINNLYFTNIKKIVLDVNKYRYIKKETADDDRQFQTLVKQIVLFNYKNQLMLTENLH
jgi:hypothetical protein